MAFDPEDTGKTSAKRRDPCSFLSGYDPLADRPLKDALLDFVWAKAAEAVRRGRGPRPWWYAEPRLNRKIGDKAVIAKYPMRMFIAIRRSVLDCLAEDDWMDLLSLVRAHLGIVILEDRTPSTKRGSYLKAILKDNSVSVYPTELPSPWPVKPNDFWPDGIDGDRPHHNMVPGAPGAPCHEVLVIQPEVDCSELPDGWIPSRTEPGDDHDDNWHPHPDGEMERDFPPRFTPDEEEEGVHPDLGPREDYHRAWEQMKHCFCKILREGVAHAEHCLSKSGGVMNSTVIVKLSHHGRFNGLENHPCWVQFVQDMRDLQKTWPSLTWSVQYYS
jgi:hypothetical protein